MARAPIFVFGSNLAGIHGAGAARWLAVLDARAPRSATAPVGRPANAVLMAQH